MSFQILLMDCAIMIPLSFFHCLLYQLECINHLHNHNNYSVLYTVGINRSTCYTYLHTCLLFCSRDNILRAFKDVLSVSQFMIESKSWVIMHMYVRTYYNKYVRNMHTHKRQSLGRY